MCSAPHLNVRGELETSATLEDIATIERDEVVRPSAHHSNRGTVEYSDHCGTFDLGLVNPLKPFLLNKFECINDLVLVFASMLFLNKR